MDYEMWSIFGMILNGETEVYREIPIPVATLFTTHPTRKGLGSREDSHSENPAAGMLLNLHTSHY
jgi:hypothetical protein